MELQNNNENRQFSNCKKEDELVTKYLPFAASIASKIARSLSSSIDFDDVLCSARLGLLEAARRFDDSLNVDFKTFAYYRIKGAIYDGLRKTGWMPRSLYAKIKLEQELHDSFLTQAQVITEKSKNLSSEIAGLSDTVQSLASMYVMSLDTMQDFEVEDEGAGRNIEHQAEFQKIKIKMRDAIEALPDKERKLVKMYYFQGKTLQEIGEKLGLSKSWTCRLHTKSLELLFKKLDMDPDTSLVGA